MKDRNLTSGRANVLYTGIPALCKAQNMKIAKLEDAVPLRGLVTSIESMRVGWVAAPQRHSKSPALGATTGTAGEPVSFSSPHVEARWSDQRVRHLR